MVDAAGPTGERLILSLMAAQGNMQNITLIYNSEKHNITYQLLELTFSNFNFKVNSFLETNT
jgi:hypothetical protein